MARLLVLEWNRPAGEIDAYAAMLREETEWDCFFCASDAMVPGFGLVDDQGQPTDAYYAFQLAQPEEDPVPDPNDAIQKTMEEFESAGGTVGTIYAVTDTPDGGQTVNTDAGFFISQPGVPGAQILLDARATNPFRATRA